MAYYLQMDGIDDRLQLPTMSATKVIIDCYIDSSQDNGRDVVFDSRTGSTFFLDVGFANVRFYIDGSSTLKTSNVDIPKDSRHTLDIRPNPESTVMTDNFTIFAKNDGLTTLKGKIYSVTVYNLTTLVAFYDLTLGNVQDQSGNGNHATLTGGTWVDDSATTYTGSGASSGIAAVSATNTLRKQLSGTSNGTSAVSTTPVYKRNAAGTSLGRTTTTAYIGIVVQQGSGVSIGVATATASSILRRQSLGTSTGKTTDTALPNFRRSVSVISNGSSWTYISAPSGGANSLYYYRKKRSYGLLN